MTTIDNPERLRELIGEPNQAVALKMRDHLNARAIDFIASPACTPRKVPRLPSPRFSSMLIKPVASGLMGGHP